MMKIRVKRRAADVANLVCKSDTRTHTLILAGIKLFLPGASTCLLSLLLLLLGRLLLFDTHTRTHIALATLGPRCCAPRAGALVSVSLRACLGVYHEVLTPITGGKGGGDHR